MRSLLATPKFEKDFKILPKKIQIQAEEIVKSLLLNPLDKTQNIRKLHSIKPILWRVRIGSYRLIYSFSKDTLTLYRMRHRKDIYRLIRL